MEKIAVLGDGAWGTTLAIHLARKGYSVSLWGAFPEYLKILSKKRENVKFLPHIPIPKSIRVIPDINETISDGDVIVFAIPSQFMREVVKKLRPLKERAHILLNVAKGIEKKTLMRMSEVISEVLGNVNSANLAVLSGPSIAYEVAQGQPTSVVVASENHKASERLKTVFTTNRFKVFTGNDVVGVELGGALKNPIAIAAGISDGLGFGSNAKAALISRGLAEMTKLGIAMGARKETFSGLSGLGDLITTCISPRSRNRCFGEQIGKGRRLRELLKETEMVVEGVDTTLAAHRLSKRYRIDVTIFNEVYAVLFKQKYPKEALRDLMKKEVDEE